MACQGGRSGWTERRDPRHKVLLRARMRAGGLPVDVCLRDVSARGVLIETRKPPPRGTIVELTGLATSIVGEVMWVDEHRFGVATRGRINLEALLASGGGAQRRAFLAAAPPPPSAPAVPPRRRLEASRHLARMVQFAFTVMVGGSAAFGCAAAAYASLSHTSQQIAAGLAPKG